MFKRLIAAALVFGMAALAPPASAQSSCAVRTDITGQLENQFSETLRALGLQTETLVVEIWISEASGTWTILVTNAEGFSCILASGTRWMERLVPDVSDEVPTY